MSLYMAFQFPKRILSDNDDVVVVAHFLYFSYIILLALRLNFAFKYISRARQFSFLNRIHF